MSDSRTLQPGQSISQGRFTLVRALGRGGMGVVWLGQDTRLGEEVALKFLPPEVAADAVALNDLRRETARSHKLTHPNIIRIHDFHEQADAAFISMEFVNGPTLSAWRLQQTNQVLTWEALAPLVQQLCAALDYAHGEGVVHRDLKPANVMLDAKGRLKLADFGIAAVVSDSVSRVTQLGTSGTLAYMSPQQLTGKRPTVTDDIYALGASLYELLTGKPPFYTGDLTHQVLHEPPEPVDERLAGMGIENPIPSDVAALIMACLAKDPAQRPQSAAAVAEWIGLTVASRPATQGLAAGVFAHPEAAPAEAPASGSANLKFIWAGVAVAGVLVLAVGGWLAMHRNSAKKNLAEGQTAAERATTTAPATTSVSPQRPAPEPSSSADSETGFISLFNGRDLTGWDGDPSFWTVQNGCIVGETTRQKIPNGNTFLVWKGGEPGDFELRLKCRMLTGNSGIQFRSQQAERWRIIGYQAEVLAFGTSFSEAAFGGLVNEPAPLLASCGEKVVYTVGGQKQVVGSTGYTLDQVRAAFRSSDWNDYTIIAQGRHIVLKLNDRVTVDFTEERPSRALSGLIALQIHRNRGEPMRVEFKDIQLKQPGVSVASARSETAAGLSWIPLFDGRTLSGWTTTTRFPKDTADWSVGADGIITGTGPVSHLFSPGSYTNFEFKAEARINAGGNSGMYFRADTAGVRPNGYPAGYEAQIGNTAGDPQKTGSLYGFSKFPNQLVADDTWFTQHIIAIGNRIVIKVNNRITTDFVDDKHTYRSGRLALQQNNPNKPTVAVQFRNVMVKPLPADESAAWAEARKDMTDLAR